MKDLTTANQSRVARGRCMVDVTAHRRAGGLGGDREKKPTV